MHKATCKITGEEFVIFDQEIEICKKFDVPLPDTAPTERFRNLMAFRNEWKLYRRKCDATGEEMLSAYSPQSPYKVFKNQIWWGDSWDAQKYGRDFDFSKTFFDQLQELQLLVPREGTSIFNSENCDYNSHIRQSRNCYLNSLVVRCEDIYYSYWMVDDQNVFDSLVTNSSQLCYYCRNVNHSYQCFFLEESNNCSECYFCYQLQGCNHCIFSSNLANKSYYAFNKPCTKEQFEEIKNKYINGTFSSLEEGKKEYEKICKTAAQRALHGLNCENVSGDNLYNCRNCENCYESFDSEHCVNCISLGEATFASNCYSAGWPACPGPIHMALVSRGCQDLVFGNYNWFSSKIRYCENLNTCDSCFGCIGLRHKKYCILNKQYSKEEYEQMVPKIIAHMKSTGEWGQFFPKTFSAFAYNETPSQDFFPLEKEEAVKRGYKWLDEETGTSKPQTIPEVPNSINDIEMSFCKEILQCGNCRKNYKIIEPEIKFYKKINLPIPRICPSCRHKERFDKRNPLMLFQRKCDNCSTSISSTYKEDRSEKVFCEKCYLASIM